jgi:hypothetical protein
VMKAIDEDYRVWWKRDILKTPKRSPRRTTERASRTRASDYTQHEITAGSDIKKKRAVPANASDHTQHEIIVGSDIVQKKTDPASASDHTQHDITIEPRFTGKRAFPEAMDHTQHEAAGKEASARKRIKPVKQTRPGSTVMESIPEENSVPTRTKPMGKGQRARVEPHWWKRDLMYMDTDDDEMQQQ